MVQILFDRLLPEQHRPSSGQAQTDSLGGAAGRKRLRPRAARADSRRCCARDASVWRRTVCLPTATSGMSQPGDVFDATAVDALARRDRDAHGCAMLGSTALASGAVAVVSLAGGVGSRWTQGAGVVKALHPFCRLGGRHRTFIEVHLAKSRRIGRLVGPAFAARHHHQLSDPRAHRGVSWPRRAIARAALRLPGAAHLSPGRAVGLRMIPMARDLRFAWEEMPQQLLDEQAQKVRDSLRARPDRLGAGGRRGQRLHR